MMNYDEAVNALLATKKKKKTVVNNIALSECAGHFLAQAIHANLDSPRFSNSAMDGYALNMPDDNPQVYALVGRIAAGQTAGDIQLQVGQAVRIFTGAPIPIGCNAVIAQEQTTSEGNTLNCTSPPKLGDHIRMQGEEFAHGATLMTQGMHLNPASIGLLAGQGYAQLPIHAPLRVVVFSSGNELTEPSLDLNPSAIYDANRYQLIAWLRALNCNVLDGGILPDSFEHTQSALAKYATDCDLIITSGGASVGEEDHLKAAVQSLGTLTQWKLSIKPGKPFAWGQVGATPIIMLPGNPVATFVTFKLLVEPMVRVRMGAGIEHAKPARLMAQAEFAIAHTGNRREFMRGILSHDAQGIAQVQILPNQGSHMMRTCVEANCLIDIAPDTTVMQGDVLSVIPINIL